MLMESSPAVVMWGRICRYIEETTTFSKDAYDQWFGNIIPLELKGDTLILGVSDEFFANWFSDNMGDLLDHAISTVMPDACINYSFEYGHQAERDSKCVEEDDPDFDDELKSGCLTREKLHRISEAKPVASAPNCKSSFTFQNFVVGEENRYAYSAAMTAAQAPGQFNPLYIYGSTGMGKTHLIQAVANDVVIRNPSSVVRYTTCEGLLNAYSDSLRNKTYFEFRNHFRQVDLLLVDDVHFLGSKEQLQEEFFNIFNTLHNLGKQIILTSDKQPAEIPGLADRLVSRFESGVITQITTPSFETRLAILRKKQERHGTKYNDEILTFIAQRITSSIRRLEGALMRLIAYSAAMMDTPRTLAQAEFVLSDFLNQEAESRKVSIDSIQKVVADYYGLRVNDLTGSKRPKNIAEPRMLAMFLSRKMTNCSLPEIGLAFGGRTHATVLHAISQVEKNMVSDESVRTAVSSMKRQLQYE